jgi:hypothetical protein
MLTLISTRVKRWKRSIRRKQKIRGLSEPSGNYRPIRHSSVSVGAVLLTLVLVTLLDHFVWPREGSKLFRKPPPLEINHLDESRKSSLPDRSVAIVDVQSPRPPSQKNPELKIAKVLPALKQPTKAPPLDPLIKLAAPAPESAVIPSPNQNSLTGYLSDLPSAPLNEPAPPLGTAAMASDGNTLEAKRTALSSSALPNRSKALLSPGSSSEPLIDAKAVITTLKNYSDAWNKRQFARITALRPKLPRRLVEQELSGVRSITMRIQPLSSPTVQGDRASVQCLHQVDQVFRDGVERQIPGVKMTYVLVKRGTEWLIEDSR